MLNQEIANLIIAAARNSCTDIVSEIDILIFDGDISVDEFYSNESEILGLVDLEIFTCEMCGWNCDIGEMSSEAQVCRNCVPDEES